ncbi:hypothetical protein DR950_01825 [Kitasatospora xanthocidica]|uniref:Uncharacterized protein n=1 Tax=Kitasatospora xanthocidica TaxID=83382 RepID=A0A372ZLI1_9ACTN|nr:hypothetical protein DR950_01825 [Kitasatospora xanthocidica]
MPWGREAFQDFPAEHWVHPRTTNPVGSTFAAVRPRTGVAKGARLPGRRVGRSLQVDRVGSDLVERQDQVA